MTTSPRIVSGQRAGSGAWGGAGDAIWSRYRHNAARHLMGIARDLEQRSLHHLVDDRGHRDLRPSFGPLLSLVARSARSVSEVAEELATSPQACSQLVDHCEAAGYVARQPAPDDRRTRIVRLTPDGERLIQDGLAILRTIEGEYRDHLGDATFERFSTSLPMAWRALGDPSPSEDASLARIGPSLGVLPDLSLRIQRMLMDATSARGHAGLKLSHAQVLPLIGAEGARVAALARIQGVSRQAISATARDLVEAGYLRRERDLEDGRGVVFLLTEAGSRLLEDSVESLEELDARLRSALGARRLRWLYDGAARLYGALGLEEDVFPGLEASIEAVSCRGADDDTLRRLAAQLVETLPAESGKRLARMIREELAARRSGAHA